MPSPSAAQSTRPTWPDHEIPVRPAPGGPAGVSRQPEGWLLSRHLYRGDCEFSAIDYEDRSGYPCGLVAEQEPRRPGHVGWLAEPLHREHGGKLSLVALVDRQGELSLHQSWGQGH